MLDGRFYDMQHIQALCKQGMCRHPGDAKSRNSGMQQLYMHRELPSERFASAGTFRNFTMTPAVRPRQVTTERWPLERVPR